MYRIQLLIFPAIFRLAIAVCYMPNGTVYIDPDYEPCDDTPTICCATGRSNPSGGDSRNGPTADTCLPNGVCQNRWSENGATYTGYWRDFCTEQNWIKGNCLNICTDGDPSLTVTITPCDGTATSERWCCGDTRACCTPDDNPNVHILFPQLGVETSSSSSRTSSTQSVSTSSTTSHSETPTSAISPSVTSTPPPESSNGGGLSSGAKAGIGIGAAIGALLLVGAGFFIAKSLQWRKKAETSANSAPPQAPPPAFVPQYVQPTGSQSHVASPPYTAQMAPPVSGSTPPPPGWVPAQEVPVNVQQPVGKTEMP